MNSAQAKRPAAAARVVCSAQGQDASKQLGTAAAAAALALTFGLTAVDAAYADVAGLTPCSESKAFAKRKKTEVKALNKRLKQYEAGSAPALALNATIQKTENRFDNYARQGLLCGNDGLPHLIAGKYISLFILSFSSFFTLLFLYTFTQHIRIPNHNNTIYKITNLLFDISSNQIPVLLSATDTLVMSLSPPLASSTLLAGSDTLEPSTSRKLRRLPSPSTRRSLLMSPWPGSSFGLVSDGPLLPLLSSETEPSSKMTIRSPSPPAKHLGSHQSLA